MILGKTRQALRLRGLRFYGWERPEDRWTKNWWYYADSDTIGIKTPEERGYQMSPEDKKRNDYWKANGTPAMRSRIAHSGTDTSQIINIELKENPLGDYDDHLETLTKSEVRTRIIYILRHFQAVDLRKFTWDDHIQDKLKLDDFDRIAFLTSVEHEFKTVFEDNVFDHMNTLNDVVRYLINDKYVL